MKSFTTRSYLTRGHRESQRKDHKNYFHNHSSHALEADKIPKKGICEKKNQL